VWQCGPWRMGGRIAAWWWHGLACVITAGLLLALVLLQAGDLVSGGDGADVLHHHRHAGLLPSLEADRPCYEWTVAA
jgi:hypothetical protein